MTTLTTPRVDASSWIPWHALPQEGGLFESTEVLELHSLKETLDGIEEQIQEASGTLAQLGEERAAARENGYQEGFELGLAQWTDAHQQLRDQADAWLETSRQRAERCLQELLATWLDAQLETAPPPLVRHLLAILKKQLPTRPRVHLRYAAQAEQAALRLHAQLVEGGWEAHFEADESLNAGLIVDHPHGRILFDTRQTIQQVMREHPVQAETDTLNVVEGGGAPISASDEGAGRDSKRSAGATPSAPVHPTNAELAPSIRLSPPGTSGGAR